MMNLILFSSTKEISESFAMKFVYHIRIPVLIEMKYIGEAVGEERVESFKQACMITDNAVGDIPKLFFTSGFVNAEYPFLLKHFNIFNVWDNPVDIQKHLQGVWVHDKSETEYLFNQIVPWVFS